MLLSKKIRENKFHIMVYGIVGISILLVTAYVSIIYSKLYEEQYEENLNRAGEIYINDINYKLSEYHSIAEMMAMSFSENVDDKNFITNSKNVMQIGMVKHQNVKLATLALNGAYKNYDDATLINDSTKNLYHISLINKGNQVVNTFSKFEDKDEELKLRMANIIQKEQTKVFNPINIMIDDEFTTVFPVVSVMYKGNYFFGYLILYINIDSPKEDTDINEYEIFTFTQSGKLISSNISTAFLNDDISKVCSSCTTNGNDNNTISSVENIKTLCFSYSSRNNISKWNVCVRSNYDTYKQKNRIMLIWVLGVACILVTFLAIYYFSYESKKLWEKVGLELEKLFMGKISIDELSDIDNAKQEKLKHTIIKVEDTLQTLTDNSLKLTSGELKDINPINQFNYHRQSIHTKFYKKFEEISKDFAHVNNQLEKLKEADQNLEVINEVIRNNHSEIVMMMDMLIKKIVSLLDLEMGSVFLKRISENTVFLEQIVSYAYNENKSNKVSFKLGSSLVGACAAEKRTVYLNKIPDNYLKIVSGLGDAPPKSILIVPLLFGDEALGVIELGSLHNIDEDTIKFVEKIATNVSVVLSLAQENKIKAELLTKSENDKKLILEQNRTIKESFAELQKIHNKTTKSEVLTQAKLESAGHALMMAEYSANGELNDTNFQFLNTLHYSLEELTRKGITELINKTEHSKIDKIINSVKLGNIYKSSICMNTKEGLKKEIYSIYAPLFDDTGTVENILFFGVDMTETQEQQNH